MNNKYIILIIILLGLFAAGGYWLGSQTSAPQNTSGKQMQHTESDDASNQKSSKNKDREILYWQAPMNPSEIYDKPGKSKMGMDLVPVYADEANSAEGVVSINPVVVQNMNVRTATVQQKDLSTTINAVGRVEYDEQKLYTVNPKISGWVEQLYVDYTGKMVEKGQPIFSIYSPELVTTQREYLLALKTRDKVSESSFKSIRNGGNSLLEATRKRLKNWDIPEAQIQQLEQSGEIQKVMTLNAPASGMVLHKNAIEGEFIKSGTPAYKIANLSTVWVQTSVYDYEVPWINEGQLAKIKLSYQPGKTYEGTVDYIYPSLDRKTRSVQVRIVIPNPNLKLKPGMFANVSIQARTKKNVTVIPSEAIIRTGERNVVFVAKGEGQFEPREVILGMEGGERNNEIEILSGIQPGEEIVISAQFLFDSESRLQEAIQKMLDQKSGSDNKTMNSENEEMDHNNIKQNNMDTDSMKSDTVDHSQMDHSSMDHENIEM